MKQNNIPFTDQELIEAYNKTPQLSLLSVQFKVPQITIFRRAQRLELKFANGTSKGKAKLNYDLNEILEGKHPQYQTFKLKNKLILSGIKKNKCEICEIETWNGLPLNMHLDHIDGDPHNHRLNNLQMLCPNCHAQTDTYCGKNK